MAPASQQATVLLGEWNQVAVGAGTRRAAGIGEQHEGEQPGHLAVIGEPLVQLTGQPDRLGAELDPRSARAPSWRCIPR